MELGISPLNMSSARESCLRLKIESSAGEMLKMEGGMEPDKKLPRAFTKLRYAKLLSSCGNTPAIIVD